MKRLMLAIVLSGLFTVGIIASSHAAQLVPLGNHVLVEIIEVENLNPAGINLPDGRMEEVVRGKVIHAGSVGILKEGDIVLFPSSAATTVTNPNNGVDYFIISVLDVLALVKD
jgi:co-chaperonin GroES (HSP10)